MTQWENCILTLTRRYVIIRTADGMSELFRIPLINILHVEPYQISDPNPLCVKINSTAFPFSLRIRENPIYQTFCKQLMDAVFIAPQANRNPVQLIFGTALHEEGEVDPEFLNIISSLINCKEPNDLKHLLGKVDEYVKKNDMSILESQKPFYINFVNCLYYLSDSIVTEQLQDYADRLISGFDDNVDFAITGPLQPKKVDISKMIRLESVAGKGKFGSVYVGTLFATHEHVALKRIEKAGMSPKDVKEVIKESTLLYRLRHNPHINRIIDFWEDDNNFYLVMELIQGGELFQAIVRRVSFTEREAQVCIQTLLYTLLFCHENGVIHRDLKPENILLKEKNNLESIVIADFGLAKSLSIDNVASSYCGTPGYIAPEVISGSPYSTAVDMWSLGVITYILLCGYHPFPQQDDKLMAHNVIHGIYTFDGNWEDKSQDAKDFISRLLEPDPAKRMTGKEAIMHRWMLFASQSTMNMNTAVQQLEQFVAKRKVHTLDATTISSLSFVVDNYIALTECNVYLNTTTVQDPVVSIPRGTVVTVDNVYSTAEGIWIHVYDKAKTKSMSNPEGKWILAGPKRDNPVCVPVNKSVYMSTFPRGKATHMLKKSATCEENVRQPMPSGFAVIADNEFTTPEGKWIQVNQQTLVQFGISIPPPVYVCICLKENILFKKIYGN